jgi:type I restriction-modification system DNA methylase subunit
MKFDVVVGNPPYNESTTSKHASSKKKGSANLAIQFVELAVSNLAPYGFVAYVTSDHWLRPTSRVRNHLKEAGHFVYADISSRDIKHVFFPNVGSTFTWWIWTNVPGEHVLMCENQRLSNDVLSSNLFANTGRYDDWVFVFNQTGPRYNWKRTKNNDTHLLPKKTVLVPLVSIKRTVIYDNSNMPVNKDFYYFTFEDEHTAKKVFEYLTSSKGLRLTNLVKSGPALTRKIFTNLPIGIS